MISLVALTLFSLQSLASPLDQFQGRFVVSPGKCSLNKYSDYKRAFVTIQGLKKNIVEIRLFGSDATLIELEIDNRIEKKAQGNRNWVITHQAMVQGNLARIRTIYALDGKVTQTVEKSLLSENGRLTLTEKDSQMPAPVVCELLRN